MSDERNPAFKVVKVDLSTGETVVSIQKGILGTLANLLIDMEHSRKRSGVVHKLGHVLKACGNAQYGASFDERDLDPSLVVNNGE